MSHNNNISENAEKSRGCGYDINKISSFLAGIHQQGERFELTALRNGASLLAVICTTDTAAEAFANLYNAASDAKGFYVTLNPSRLPERVTPSPNRNKDEHIEKRTHLMVDIDGCKNGTTPEERNALRAASIELAKRISAELTAAGWPEPVIVNSGNGAQMWYAIDEPTESDIVRRCLEALGKRYNGNGLDIDTGVCNASRLGRLPRTWNRKPEYPADEWRMAEVVSEPVMGLEVVPHGKLEELAKDAPAEQAAAGSEWGGIKTVPGLELDTEENRKLYREYLRHREGGVEGDGGRGNFLETARFGGDFGLSPEAIWEELTTAEDDNGVTYNDRCEPPWEYDEALKVIRSSFDGRREPVGCKAAAGKGYQMKKLFEDNPIPEPVADNTTEAKPAAESGNDGKVDLTTFYKYFKSFDELFAGKPAPPETWLLDGFLSADSDLVLWAGAGGAGKTTLTTQLSQALVQGGFFPLEHNNTPGFIVETTIGGKPTKVAYVSTEEAIEKHHRRFEHQIKAQPTREPGRRFLMNLYDAGMELFTTQGGAEGKIVGGAHWEIFKNGLLAEGINILFIDNLSNIMPGNENSRTTVASFCKLLYELNRSGIKVILLSHTNKSGLVSGSTGWLNQARQVILTTAVGTKDNRRYKTEVIKVNGDSPGSVFYSVFDKDTWCHKAIPESVYTEKASLVESDNGQRREDAREAILRCLTEQRDDANGGDSAVSTAKLTRLQDSEGFPFGGALIREALEVLVEEGDVIKTETKTKSTAKGQYGKMIEAYKLPA